MITHHGNPAMIPRHYHVHATLGFLVKEEKV